MYRKIIPILVVSLVITSIAFGQVLLPKVFVGEKEVKTTVVDGETYIPVSELERLNIMVVDYQGATYIKPKPDSISDIDTAYRTLTELHEKFLKRMKSSTTGKTKNETIELLNKQYEETFYDLIKLRSIQIEPVKGIATNICITKDYFYTSLMLSFQAMNITINGLNGNNKNAKNEIQTIKPTAVLFGKYTEASFKALDEEYKKYQEETKQGN